MGRSFPSIRPYAVGEVPAWSATEASAFDAL
jgi:hypothetical protein